MTSVQPTPGAGTPGSDPQGTNPAGAPGDSPGSGPLDDAGAAALQRALQAENAAVWAYALVAAKAPDDQDLIAEIRTAHVERRDATAGRLTAAGRHPVPPAPAYRTPKADNTAAARKLAITIENDCALAWRAMVGATEAADLRLFASRGLTDAAVRTVQWKQRAKITPVTEPFPGRPS